MLLENLVKVCPVRETQADRGIADCLFRGEQQFRCFFHAEIHTVVKNTVSGVFFVMSFKYVPE